MNLQEKKEVEALAVRIRLGVLDAIHGLGAGVAGHLGGSLSMSDTMAVLYGHEMKYDPKNPKWEGRDRLVISKGHCGPAVYATLAVKGFFPYEKLGTMNRPGTDLPSHTDRNKTPGIDMTTGSLGQGISMAVGLAAGERLRGRDTRVFTIVGDGEANEGQVWEACMFAAAHKLGNLVVMIDWNKRQLDGFCEEIYPVGHFEEKLRAFGLDAVTVDGNDAAAVAAALENTRKGGEKPYAIVLDTVKGAGIPEVENTPMNHSLGISDEQYERWSGELKAKLAELEA